MRLALREMVRRPSRFVTATAILTLVAALLMFLGALLDGLIEASTGAVEAQDAAAIVYSDTAQASFLRSRIDPDLRATVEGVDGVDEVGGIGLVQLGARVPGNDPRDLANTAIFGYELAPTGVPAPPESGQAYVDEVLEADGVEVGMTIEVGPARSPLEVIGTVSGTNFNGQGGVWVEPGTWREVLGANRPDSRLAEGVFQALVVQGDDGVAARIDEATGGRTDSYTIDDAIAAIPGVTEQQSTFNQIIGVTLVVAVVVIALFFALLTVERTALYGVFKALGARSSTIFTGLVVQAVVITLLASLVAGVAVVALGLAVPPGSIPLTVSALRIAGSVVLLLVAAVVGSAFSLRRVLHVDPASAIG